MSYKTKTLITAVPVCWLEDGFIYQKDGKANDNVYNVDNAMWYSMALDQSFAIPNPMNVSRLYLQNRKFYYANKNKEFVEYDPITEATKVLITDTLVNVSTGDNELGSAYMRLSDNSYLNVKSGKLFINFKNSECLVAQKYGFAIVVKFINEEEKDNQFNCEYEISGYYLANETHIFTVKGSERISSDTRWSSSSAIKHGRVDKLIATCRIINSSTVYVDGTLHNIKETSEKPRCAVCRGKLKVPSMSCCLVLPCEHKGFHYACVGSECPQCKEPVTKKIAI
jgi:hypothetical protein